MTHLENNYEEFKEIRARADSIANSIFLIAGGALSLSVNVLLNAEAKGLIPEHGVCEIKSAWSHLLAAIIIFIILKGELVLHAHLFQFKTHFINKHLIKLNLLSWVIGGLGFYAFIFGMIKLTHVAYLIIST